LWASLFGTEFFVIHPLTSVTAISWVKLNSPLTHRGVLHIFALLPEPERHGFTPKGGYLWCLGGDQSPLLPPETGLNLNPVSYHSDKRCFPPLIGSCASPEDLLCIQGLRPNSLGWWVPPLYPTVLWHLVGSSPSGQGDAPWWQGRWQMTISEILDNPPRNVVGISSWDSRHWGSLGGSNVLLCQHRLNGLVSKGWAPRTKDAYFTYLQAGYRSKKQSSTHIWLCVTLLDICSPSAM
jgi:hypothetical protein